MDVARPVVAVIPGVQGRILAVLAETTAELNLRTIARLSGVSLAQASRVLPLLVDLGIVERREAPPSALFRFVPENVASRAIAALARTRQAILEELGDSAGALDPTPVSVVVFGSLARGEATPKSDIDVVVVRPREVDEDEPAWREGIDTWREHAYRHSGNRVDVLEVSEVEVGARLRSRKPLWADIRREGVVVHGRSLDALREPVGA
jgi:predicted nucleotidyltransferase